MFSNNHTKFHAFITKVNNSVLFWPLAARLDSLHVRKHSSKFVSKMFASISGLRLTVYWILLITKL